MLFHSLVIDRGQDQPADEQRRCSLQKAYNVTSYTISMCQVTRRRRRAKQENGGQNSDCMINTIYLNHSLSGSENLQNIVSVL